MKPEPSFYVGYMKKTPADLAAFNRMLVSGLAVLIVAAVAVMALQQGPFEHAEYEFGKGRAR